MITEVGERLAKMLNKQATNKCIDIVTRTVQNTFYDQIWRVQCRKIQEWEKENNITSKMKKGIRRSEKVVKGQCNKRKKEKRKTRKSKPNEERSLKVN